MNLESLRDLLEANVAFENPLVRVVTLSPAVFRRVESCIAAGTMTKGDGVKIVQSAALLDHMVHLAFASGRAGFWDMRGESIKVWTPMGAAR